MPALRLLRTQPRLSAIAILVLAVGIGANTALFSVLNALLFRPLPYARVEELVELEARWDAAREVASMASVAAFIPRGFTVDQDGVPVNLYGMRVSDALFHVLGAKALIGRAIEPGDVDQRVVVLGYDYWRRISGRPDIVGKSLTLSDEARTVVGVMPPGFGLQVRDANVYVPYRLAEGRVVGRLRPGIGLAQADAELKRLAGREARVVPLHLAFQTNDSRDIMVLQAAVGLVLLLACVNVASLLLVRTGWMRREFAIRAALGASRARIFGQALLETAPLGLAGGGLGLLLAHQAAGLMMATLPGSLPRTLRGADPLAVDLRVLGFAIAVSMATVVLCGLAPALGAVRFDVAASLRDSGRSASGSQRWGQWLVGVEIALAVTLLAAAGLAIKSLAGLETRNLGFDADRVVRAAFEIPAADQHKVDQILGRMGALPGVEGVGIAMPQLFPFGGPRVRGARFQIPDKPGLEARAELYWASPAYFRTLRIPLLRGRAFDDTDRRGSQPVALLSHMVARRYWGDEEPLGRTVVLGGDPVVVVGVVGDVRNPVGLDWQPTAYRPLAQTQVLGGTLYVRGSGELLEPVRLALRQVVPRSPDFRVSRLDTAVAAYLGPQRYVATLYGVFALAGLLLACAGVYGVMRHWVAMRTREIGIRAALGATRGQGMRLVLGRCARVSTAGACAGVGGALLARNAIATQIYDVNPTDPTVLGGVAVAMVVVAILAALAPALRASRVDPAVALREQ
jgi:predicted permease